MLVRARLAALEHPSVFLVGGAIGLSLVSARMISRSGSISSLPLVALLGLAGAAILLSLRPETLFLSWLALAPFLQESAGANPLGHPLALVFYTAPSLVFLLWTLTARGRTPGPGFIDVLPLLYFSLVLVSLLLTGDHSTTSIKAVYATVGIGMVLYYFFAFGPILSSARERVITLLLVLALLEAVMSILDGLTGWNLWHDTGWQEGPHSRAVATLSLPAALGAFIGMGIALAVAVLVWRGPPRLRPLAIATVAIGLPGVFFTYTRAPIIATLVVTVLILASCARTRLFALASLILAIAVVAATWSQINSSSVYRERATNKGNVEVRSVLASWSLELAAERPLFGWGYGSFDRIKNKANLSSGPVKQSDVASTSSHNTFLTILVEYGGIGLALLLVPWLTIGWRAVAQASRRSELRWFIIGSLGALAIYIFTANANDLRFFSFVPALPWLFLGLLRRHQLANHE